MFNKDGLKPRTEYKVSIETLFEDSKQLWEYLAIPRGYNMFLIDEIDSLKVLQLRKYIDTDDKINAVKLYKELSLEVDRIRDKHCYNVLPYKSSFRQLAKEMYIFLKETWLLYTDQFFYIGKTLRFISTSSLYEINRYFRKRSYSMFYMERINIDPDKFYCNHITLEAFMDYAIKLLTIYIKENNKYV